MYLIPDVTRQFFFYIMRNTVSCENVVKCMPFLPSPSMHRHLHWSGRLNALFSIRSLCLINDGVISGFTRNKNSNKSSRVFFFFSYRFVWFENNLFERVCELCSLFLVLPEVNGRESITLGLKLTPSARDLEHRTNLIRLSDARCTKMTCITVHVLNHELAPSITQAYKCMPSLNSLPHVLM